MRKLTIYLLFLLTFFNNFAESFSYNKFAQLPVLLDGRVKPWDTVARNSLLIMQSRQKIKYKGKVISPQKWLTQVVLQNEVTDDYPIFDVRHPEVLAIFSIKKERQRISFNQYLKGAKEFDKVFRNIQQKNREYEQRFGSTKERPLSAFEKATLELYRKILRYHKLRLSVNLYNEDSYQKAIGVQSEFFRLVRSNLKNKDSSQQAVNQYQRAYQLLLDYKERVDASLCRPFPILDTEEWQNPAEAYLSYIYGESDSLAQQLYARIYDAYRQNNIKRFNTTVDELLNLIKNSYKEEANKNSIELFFNKLQPFYIIILLYTFAFLLATFSWFGWSPKRLKNIAYYFVITAFIIHTLGLIMRILILDYAPVINLYSSAVFVGWGSVLLAIIIEYLYDNGLGSFCAGIIGCVTGIIAHNLSLSGDTMQMMQAVLDSNFWLSTHVICVTIGYSGTFFAGAIAFFYILLGLTKKLTPKLKQELSGAIYGTVCFATLTSFVGTVLGGIWADQSWGRFWGWDPKENGALLVVFWNILILHCRWGRIVSQRGIAQLAIFGNIITSLAWFGVNMLSVGLHSYGFNENGLVWLIAFIASQLIIISLAQLIPKK